MDEKFYYNYYRIISYNALLNMLIGPRGIGKTFGSVEFVTDQFIKKKDQFVYLRRYKTELSKSLKTFFSSVIKEDKFPNHKLETKGWNLMIDEEIAGYGLTLSTAQQLKSSNFPNVKTIIFDEFLIEPGQGHYIKNEVFAFLGLIETIARTRNIRVLMLGNSVSEINPYFLFFDITIPYNNDIKLFKDGMILLQYIKETNFQNAKKETRFGKLVSGTEFEDYAVSNKFIDENKNFIEKKSGTAKFSFSFIYKGSTYGIWIDYDSGKLYVSNDYLQNGLSFATTTEDHKPNTMLYSIAKKYNCWNVFIQNYKLGNVYFENMRIKNISKEVLKNIILRS